MIKSRILFHSFGDYNDNGGLYFPAMSCTSSCAVYLTRNGMNDKDVVLSNHKEYRLKAYAYHSTPDFEPGYEEFFSTEQKRPRFNNCDHLKHGTRCLPYTGVCIAYLRFASFYQGCMVLYNMAPPEEHTVEKVVNHPLIDLSAAQRTAWHTMQPEFEGNVSMLNFLFELKDFKDIAKYLLKSPIGDLSRYVRRQEQKRERRWRDGDPSAGIATAHLTWSFAVRPLISDLLEITKQLKTLVSDAQNQFQLDGLEGNTRYYTETFVHEDEIDWSDANKTWLKSGELYTTKFTACLDYSFDYTMRSKYDAFMAYWGLNLNAEAAWNALPGSFLVDYLFNIGNTLSILRHDQNVDLFVAQYCESLLTSRTAGKHIDASAQMGPVAINNKIASGKNLITGSYSELYTRKVMEPNKGTVIPTFSPPSKAQWLNVAALVRMLL